MWIYLFPLCYTCDKGARKRSSDLTQIPYQFCVYPLLHAYRLVLFESITGYLIFTNFLRTFSFVVASNILFSWSSNSSEDVAFHLPVSMSICPSVHLILGLAHACVVLSFSLRYCTPTLAATHIDKTSTNLPRFVSSRSSILTSTSFPCSCPRLCNYPSSNGDVVFLLSLASPCIGAAFFFFGSNA
ncbi:hypothetical protein HD806DRAFT_18820 [Xylariaceae sp. AK1471]|nr:hypothetical protein HD806DRAFT_18820 [Xylariaceae sp. AK1471]